MSFPVSIDIVRASLIDQLFLYTFTYIGQNLLARGKYNLRMILCNSIPFELDKLYYVFMYDIHIRLDKRYV